MTTTELAKAWADDAVQRLLFQERHKEAAAIGYEAGWNAAMNKVLDEIEYSKHFSDNLDPNFALGYRSAVARIRGISDDYSIVMTGDPSVPVPLGVINYPTKNVE